MPSIYPEHAPMPRAFLAWDGTAYRVCSVDANGRLQVDVNSSALPAGAATAANQALILARQIKHVTRFSARLNRSMLANGVAAGTVSVDSGNPGAGVWWLVTTVGASNLISGNTVIQGGVSSPAGVCWFGGGANSVQFELVSWSGQLLLTGTDFIRVQFRGCTAGDNLRFFLNGWIVDIT